MTTTPKIIIFTDLDGPLLDRKTYSFEAALPAIHLVKQKGIPLVLSTSKTRAEIELYRKRLENDHPFICENGGAVFIPKDYFSFRFPYERELDWYFVIELGTFYLQIIEVLESIRKETAIPIKGFSDLTAKELKSLCGLSLEEAESNKEREYDEPFIVEGGQREIEIVRRKIQEKGLNYVWGGRFHRILGKNDKGKAVEILRELYENQFFSILTVGIGGSLNDVPMLLGVDEPILLKEEDDLLPEGLSSTQNLTVIEGRGPKVWSEAVLNVLKKVKT